MLRDLIEGGDLSGFGLVNAVTHYSQQVDDYDRATDLEAIGGRYPPWRQARRRRAPGTADGQ